MSVIVDLETYSDADMIESFLYQTADGEPIDMTEYTMRMMVRKNAGDATAEFECSTFNGRLWWNDQAGGAFTLQIPISILSRLQIGDYVHSLIATHKVSMLRMEIWRGALIHSAGPTRWDLDTP